MQRRCASHTDVDQGYGRSQVFHDRSGALVSEPVPESRLADRLEALMTSEGGPAQLARRCGINKSTVPNLITRLRERGGERGGGSDLFYRLEKYTGCNPKWLAEGQEPMYIKRSDDPFQVVLDERAWHSAVVAAMREIRKDGVQRTAEEWRRQFFKVARSIEPTPVPASSQVRPVRPARR